MSRRARHRAPVPPLVDVGAVARAVVATGALATVPVVATAGAAFAYVDHRDGTVTVQRGDTVSSIARATGHSTQAVLDHNGLGWYTTIHPGQDIVLPSAAAPSDPVAAPAAPAPAAPPAQPTPSPPAPETSAGAAALDVARQAIGLPYRSGGTSPATGFDCSGLVQHAYAKVGVALPRTSAAMRSAGYEVSVPRAGDLVIFSGLSHVGIYAGNGKMVDSPRPGRSVSERTIWTDQVTYRRVA